MKLNFNFITEDNKKSVIKWTSYSIILISVVLFLHKCTGISEKNIWNLIDQIQRELVKKGNKPSTTINEQIIKNPELLKRRIKGDVDSAIQQYEQEERKLYKPNMKNADILREIEKTKYTETQRLIIKDAVYYECQDGTMGIHAIWYNSKECN